MRKLLFFILFCNTAFGQSNFIYKEIPDTLIAQYQFPIEEFSRVSELFFKKGVNIVKYLPDNYSKNGDVDYTSFLQKGINENDRIIMPNFPVLVSPQGLHLKSNTKLLFQPNSKLIIKSNSKANYHGILIDNVENVDLYYPKIVGDKYSHQSKEGQWGMGIWIKHSNDINIYTPVVSQCWGDGVYIGNEKNKTSSNINIYNAFLDDNRRNGLSITSGKHILIKNPLISNTNGHNPRSGIDIEPNTNKDVIENISIDSPITYNNAMHGIVVSVGNLAGELIKNISVQIHDPIDYYSTIGIGLSVTRENLLYNNKINGYIQITNPTLFNNSHAAIKNYKGKRHNVKLKLENGASKGTSVSSKNKSEFLKSFDNSKEAKLR